MSNTFLVHKYQWETDINKEQVRIFKQSLTHDHLDSMSVLY